MLLLKTLHCAKETYAFLTFLTCYQSLTGLLHTTDMDMGDDGMEMTMGNSINARMHTYI